MRVIFANRYFYPDQSATSRMVSALAFGLAKRGFDVTAIASRSYHDRPDGELKAHETISGVKVVRLPSSRSGRRSIPHRILDYLLFHFAAFFWMLRHVSRGDACVVCTDPPLLSVSSAAAIRLKGGHLVNWVMDLFPETATELGVFSEARFGGTLPRRLRDWSLAMSSLTICPTASMADYLSGKGVPKDRILALYHWSDAAEIYPVAPEENRLRAEWGLKDVFVVGYSGNFGLAHEFATLIEAATLLRDEPGIRFLMIGGGQQQRRVCETVRQRALENVIFKPLQPVSAIAESLSTPDVHIVSLLPRLEHCIVPSKFYGILAAGRPTIFIGDAKGEVARAVIANDCGTPVEIGQSEQLARIIRTLKDSAGHRTRMAANARRLLETEYSYERALDSWCAVLARLESRIVVAPAISRRLRRQPS
ncbi:MAG: glycosyltransferase family 4 protein [Shinella sp.]|nr:glycosyltransferase family 4 protein [Shinella sp.]